VTEIGTVPPPFYCPLCKNTFKAGYDGAMSTEIYLDFELLERMSIEYENYMK
jgi:hypothetical protein